MISRLLLFLGMAACYQTAAADSTLSLPRKAIDTLPPVINYKPFNESHVVQRRTTVSVQVTDESGIAGVNLYYRLKNSDQYIPMDMRLAKGSADIYTTDLPWSVSDSQNLEFFIDATDKAGNHKVYRAAADTGDALVEHGPMAPVAHNSGPTRSRSASGTNWYPVVGSILAAGLIYTLADRDGDGGHHDDGVTIKAPAPLR